MDDFLRCAKESLLFRIRTRARIDKFAIIVPDLVDILEIKRLRNVSN